MIRSRSSRRRRLSRVLSGVVIASAALACVADREDPNASHPPANGGPRVHPAGIIDPQSPDWHGTLLRSRHWSAMLHGDDEEACGRCHDGTPARPANVKYAAPGAPACTQCHTEEGGVLACSTCHGQSGGRAYPPDGPHAVHVEATATHAQGFACATCHPTPTAPEVIGGLHGDGVVEIAFDTARVGPEGSYDPRDHACAVTCHDRGGARARPAWTDKTPATCNDCHHAPPPNHYPGACTTCHAQANANGTALAPGALHLNGRVDLGGGGTGCGACHGDGANDPWPKTGAHRAHAQPTSTEPIACSDCHVVPSDLHSPGHLDGVVELTFSGRAVARGARPTYDKATQTCADVACHGAKLPELPRIVPVWSDTTGAAHACNACHNAPPTVNHPPSSSCSLSTCHGSEVGPGPSITPTPGKQRHVNGTIDVAP